MRAQVKDSESETKRGGRVVAEADAEETVGRINLESVAPVVVCERICKEQDGGSDRVVSTATLKNVQGVPNAHFHAWLPDLLLDSHARLFVICKEGREESVGGKPLCFTGIRCGCGQRGNEQIEKECNSSNNCRPLECPKSWPADIMRGCRTDITVCVANWEECAAEMKYSRVCAKHERCVL